MLGLALSLRHAGATGGAGDPVPDPRLARGLAWLATHFAVDRNPFPEGRKGVHDRHFYYLWAIERAGSVLGIERFGAHAWYDEGARYLLTRQREDGAFVAPENEGGEQVGREIEDTCFGVLFLRRGSGRLGVR